MRVAAIPFFLVLASGCVVAVNGPPGATNSPTPGWFAARFEQVSGVAGDTTSFDTRTAPSPSTPRAGSTVRGYKNPYCYMPSPAPYLLESTIWEGEVLGRTTRLFDLQLLARPTESKKVTLAASLPITSTALFTYTIRYRHSADVWAANSGQLTFAVRPDGSVGVTIRDALMTPARDVLFPPEALGTAFPTTVSGSFTIQADGEFPPPDPLEPTPPPCPSPTPTPLPSASSAT
jgi:hypothetical protein